MGSPLTHDRPANLRFSAGPVPSQACSDATYRTDNALPPISVQHLPQNQIDLWLVPLDLPRDTQQAFERILSSAEKERAFRFRFQHLTSRYINAHGSLRQLLGRYLKQPPDTIDFTYGPQGKPDLLPALNPEGIQFNMAHSDGLAAIAVTRTFRIGVDIEMVRPIPDADDLVNRFFSQRETTLFRNLPAADRSVAFLQLWTRKEAWLKATGEGIAHLLNKVEVSFGPGLPAKLLTLPTSYSIEDWSLVDVSPQTGVVLAVALNSSNCKLLTRWMTEFPEDLA